MNPAQFQNMGPGAGGMPNNMLQQQQMRAVPNLTPQQIQRIIVQNLTQHTQSLQAQGKFVGWHSTMQIEQRAGQVKLLIDSLRLIQPVVAYDQAINVALTFEQKAFSQEPSRERYLATIKEKLSRIQDTRASQVQSQSNNLQQMMQPGQNMAFNPHLQQQMQPSSMVPQGLPQGQNPGQPMMTQGQQNMQQRASISNQRGFTDEDNKNINQLAAEMAKKTPNEDMRRIRETLTEQQKLQMAAKNVDPLAFYFRAQATKEYSRRKFAAQVQNAQNGGARAQQQMQAGQVPQNFDMQATSAPFPGGLDRFQGQQAEGMRSQEVGELVVPVSNTQGMNAEQFQLHKQMIQNQRQAAGNANPALAQQQNLQNRQAQAQAQAQVQARVQAATRAQLGLPGQPSSQGPSQSTTPLSQINRPVGPNVQAANAQGINRPPSRPPQQPQPGMPGQAPQQQPGQNPFTRFPAELQAILRTKHQSEWKATAQAYLAQQQQEMRRTVSQQPNSTMIQTPQPGQIQQLPNGQFLGGSTIGPSPMQQSLSSGALPIQGQPQPPRSQPENAQQMLQQQQQQRQMQQNQELARQRQMQLNQIQQQQLQNQQQQVQLQQQLQAGQQQQQPQMKPGGLNPAQINYMDQQEAHQTIARNLQQHQNWSSGIKTWGQLKQWLQRNPISTLPISKIEEVQKTQFGHIMRIKQQQHLAQQQQQAGGMPFVQPGMQGQQIPPQMQMAQQGRPGMPPQAVSGRPVPQIRPIAPEEIANAKRINPQFQNVPDDQLRAFLYQQRLKQAQNRMNEQSQNPQAVFMPVQTGQTGQIQAQQPGGPMVRQPSTSGARPGAPQQMPQGPQRTPSARAQQGQAPDAAQLAARNLKRPSEVEGGQAAQAGQQPNRPQQQPAPSGLPQITREQFDKMTPLQQQRYMQMKRLEARNREAGLAIIQLTKEVQSSLPPRKGIPNMNAANKARATKLLMQDQTKNMLGRFDQFIVQFLSLSNDQEAVKRLLTQRFQLVPQYKPQSVQNKTWEVADQFSMTADQIEHAISDMFQKYQLTLQRSAQLRQGAQPVQSQGPPAPQQLTPGNLELLEQQEAQRRNSKTSKGKDVPPAPTTSQPPFTFGDARGQGTPKYASVGLKQEDLKLDPKRRKRNPPTPVTPAPGTKPSPAVKTEQQPGRKTEPDTPFKCSVLNCEHRIKGFATQTELEAHVATTHRPVDEPVADPISFFMENLHKGLGLDGNGVPLQNKPEAPHAHAQPMQKSLSTASAAIKLEAVSGPTTPAAQAQVQRPSTAEDAWAAASVKPDLLADVFSGPDPFAMEFNLDEFVAVYKESEQWKNLPRADPTGGFCADWKEPAEERAAREEKRLARLTGGDIKSPAQEGDSDLVDLGIEGIDLDKSDPEWEEIDNMDLDKDMDMGSSWEDVGAEAPELKERVLIAEEFSTMSWDDTGDTSMQHSEDDARSHVSYESLDWDAMFTDESNVVPGTNGMQVRNTIVRAKTAKA
jgi:hypothetical protein